MKALPPPRSAGSWRPRSLCAPTNEFRQEAKQRNPNSQGDDGEVDEIVDSGRSGNRQIERFSRRLDDRALKSEDVVLIFLRVGSLGLGRVSRLRGWLRLS